MADGAGPPHLLWVNHYAVAPTEGGGTRHFELGRELVRRGWRVTIIASDFTLHSRRYSRRSDPRDRSPVREEIDGVEFIWAWASRYTTNDWRRVGNWLTFGRAVADLSWSLRPSLVIGSSPDLFAAFGAQRLAARARVPFVLEVRDLWPESILAAGGRKGIGYHGLGSVARYLYRRADGVVVLTPGVAQVLRSRVKVPVTCVPNGVDIDAFKAPPRGARSDVRFVYVGAHGPMNGLDTVLDAAQLLRSRPEIRIDFVGDGPDKSKLVAQARRLGLPNVRFLDSVAKHSVPSLLHGADAGLMVLRNSPLFEFGISPNKLFDYLGASLPVVSNVGGEVAGMLDAAGAGIQASPGDATALARAIEAMADAGGEERSRRGLSGQAWVAATHSRPILAARLDSALRALL
ncbi:MAG: glycosyltransferase family 4 protein [Gemmatimonadales bacterium]